MAMFKATDTETKDVITKEGYARLRCHSMFSKWKKKWVVLKDSVVKSEKQLNIFKSEKSRKKSKDYQVISLENIASLEISDVSNSLTGLNLKFKDSTVQMLIFNSASETKQWFDLLYDQCFGNHENKLEDETIKKKDELDVETDSTDNTDNRNTICRDCFDVILQPSAKLNVSGDCSLQIIPGYIQVYDSKSSDMNLASWPISSMRRFGFDHTKFTFEAGRHCDTGEGIFVFKTKEGEQINKIVQSYAQELAVQTRKLSTADANDNDDDFELRPLPPIPPD